MERRMSISKSTVVHDTPGVKTRRYRMATVYIGDVINLWEAQKPLCGGSDATFAKHLLILHMKYCTSYHGLDYVQEPGSEDEVEEPEPGYKFAVPSIEHLSDCAEADPSVEDQVEELEPDCKFAVPLNEYTSDCNEADLSVEDEVKEPEPECKFAVPSIEYPSDCTEVDPPIESPSTQELFSNCNVAVSLENMLSASSCNESSLAADESSQSESYPALIDLKMGATLEQTPMERSYPGSSAYTGENSEAAGKNSAPLTGEDRSAVELLPAGSQHPITTFSLMSYMDEHQTLEESSFLLSSIQYTYAKDSPSQSPNGERLSAAEPSLEPCDGRNDSTNLASSVACIGDHQYAKSWMLQPHIINELVKYPSSPMVIGETQSCEDPTLMPSIHGYQSTNELVIPPIVDILEGEGGLIDIDMNESPQCESRTFEMAIEPLAYKTPVAENAELVPSMDVAAEHNEGDDQVIDDIDMKPSILADAEALSNSPVVWSGEKKHMCYACGQRFRFQSALTKHVMKHMGQKLHTCPDCGKTYLRLVNLNSHIKSHAPGWHPVKPASVRPFSCTDCGKRFIRALHLENHLLTHTGEKFHVCPTCKKAFGRLDALYQHMNIHTGESPHVCSICAKSFIGLSGLKCHMMKHTGVKPYACPDCGKTFVQNSVMKTHRLIHTGAKPCVCSECGKAFRRSDGLQAHMKVHMGEMLHLCPHCGEQFSLEAKFKIHMKTHTKKKPYVCSVCGEQFSALRDLTNHVRGQRKLESQKGFSRSDGVKKHTQLHTKENPCVCSDCGKQFRKLTSLVIHRRVHTNVKSHKCPDCDRLFMYPGVLKIHMRIHTGERHMCPECGKVYTMKVRLDNHMLAHMGDRPFVCLKCGETYPTLLSLNMHNRGKHEPQKQHICNICGRIFGHLGNLRRHRESHERFNEMENEPERLFMCSVCNKIFNRLGNVKRHMLQIHSTEKPHVCTVCGKAYGEISSLKEHLFSHQTERPHVCPHCGDSFTRRPTLEKHLALHIEKPYVCSQCGERFSLVKEVTAHAKTHPKLKRRTCPDCGKHYRVPNRVMSTHVHTCLHKEQQAAAEPAFQVS